MKQVRLKAKPWPRKRGPMPPWLYGNPEWEAMKAVRRNLSPQEAVRECNHLSNMYRSMRPAMAGFQLDLMTIVRTLKAKKIPFVVTGAHGIGSWTGRPRSTHDIDILVKEGRNHGRAVKAIRELYPQLEARTFAGLTAFFVPGEKYSVIDVSYPHRADLADTLRKSVWIEDQGEKYRVPTLETALANKYGAMLTPTRNVVKRNQDIVDFLAMVTHADDPDRDPIDMEILAALGDKVLPGGGAKEIVKLVEQCKAGAAPNLAEIMKGLE